MATIIEPYTYRRGFKEPAETNPWEPNMVNGATDGDVEDEKQHYDVPPSVELLTSPVHNYLGYNYMRTWPTIYDGTASPHGPPSWWKPSSKVDVLICGGKISASPSVRASRFWS
jgi:phenol 2-monooxygenase